jgi:two-component system sensor histidine kinase KdpD
MNALRRTWRPACGYLLAIGLVALFTGIVALVRSLVDAANVSMVYLLAVIATAIAGGSRPAILAALASFLAFNFFFIEPHYTFRVANDDEWVALALLLATGVVTGQLAAALRDRAIEAERREKEAVVLYDVVRLVSEPQLEEAMTAVAERLRNELRLSGVLMSLSGDSPLVVRAEAGDSESLRVAREAASLPERILGSGQAPTAAERGTLGRWIRIVHPLARTTSRQLHRGRARALPVVLAGRRIGSIVVVRPPGAPQSSSADDRLLSAVAHQLGLAVQRLRLQQEVTDAEVLRRTDELRTALLNAVSHDLRTPLSSIIASAGSLLQEEVDWAEAEKRDFARAIVEEAQRLDRLVGNLLDLSRIEAGSIQPAKGWYDLGSLVNEVAGRLRQTAPAHTIALDLPEELPPLYFDYVEIDQVLTNLVDNAARHTPAGTEIRIGVLANENDVRVEVTDSGPGIRVEALPHVFKAFYRAPGPKPPGGSGLGLAVARGLVEAHGGQIWAENRAEGGAQFVFTLPRTERPAAAA